MKRPKIFMPRTGMRFDRRPQQGGIAGFIGGDIQAMTTTGSVEKSLTQSSGRYSYPTVPFAGYPRTPGEMSLACGNRGTWVAGFLLEETDSGLTSSFSSMTMDAINQDKIAYRMVGPRGPGDDFATGFAMTGSGLPPYFQASAAMGSGAFALTSQSDIALLWVGRQKMTAGVGSDGYMFTKTNASAGWLLKNGGISTGIRLIATLDGFGGADVVTTVGPDQWYVGLLTIERGVSLMSVAGLNIATNSSSVGSTTSLAGMGDLSATSTGFRFGGTRMGVSDIWPPDMVVSAFYIASGTNAASGIIGNERSVLESFTRVITARNGFLFSGSAEVDRSLSTLGTSTESAFLNQKLLGLGTSSLGRSRGVTLITTGSVPSWTNSHIRNSAFVATTLSSSNHESQVLNAYRSGSEAVETTAVPASASMYFSKKSRFQTVTVKKTASVLDLTRLPAGMDGASAVYYVPGKGTDVSTVTGALSYFPAISAVRSASTILPCVFPIEVPYSGKIVDIKVWLEIVHTSGSGEIIDSTVPGGYPLGTLTIGLRSPNVRGFHAHPIRNDPALKKVFTSNLTDFTAWGGFGSGIGQSFFGPDIIAPMYRDTFLLWEGPSTAVGLAYGGIGPWDEDAQYTNTEGFGHFVTSRYPSWQRDRNMRTIFSDGSRIPNPRHHVGSSPSASFNGAPNAYFGFNSAYGFDVPWTSETELSGANTYALAGSPPKGWLTGPGGVAGALEWPTTGVNYGTENVRPLYPLLDPIYQRKRFGDLLVVQSTGGLFQPEQWTGFRPGLRNTEASGTWYLLISDGRGMTSAEAGYNPTYFRQVRLELTLDTGAGPAVPRNQSSILPRKRKEEVLIHSISGSDTLFQISAATLKWGTGSWDAHVSDTYLWQDDSDSSSQIGRTMGIAFLTGTAMSSVDAALYYRLTGTLGDLSGTTPGWLLNNGFGIPSIPLSSGSLVENTAEPIVSIHPQDIISVRPILDAPQRLSDAARDVNPTMTRAQLATALVSGTLT